MRRKQGSLCSAAPGPLLDPGSNSGPRPRPPALNLSLHLPALALNLCLPALAPNLDLPALTKNNSFTGPGP